LSLVTAAVFHFHYHCEGSQADDLPLFEMEEFDVLTSATNFSPEFSSTVPAFSLYEQQSLPRGDLIMAIHFVDQYRESEIPGPVKWIGILHFPILDGYERAHLKWLCLYAYGDRMFGYDPSPLRENLRHFDVPIPVDERLNPKFHIRFAHGYVDAAYGEDYVDWIADEMDDFEDSEDMPDSGISGYNIPAGRIAAVLASQFGRDPDELVRLVYQYVEDPNPNPAASGEFIAMDAGGGGKGSIGSFFKDLTTPAPDPLETARQLLAPRWSQRVNAHLTRYPFFFMKTTSVEQVLVFNVSTRIFAYHPIHGVWRTDATTDDLAEPSRFLSKIKIPGDVKTNRAEFVWNAR
jgi:hypothetical protein